MSRPLGMRLLFTCAVCQRGVTDYDFRIGRDCHLAPLCRYCEQHYAERAPTAGSFMDRRKAVQISALANVLRGEAGVREWEAKYGRA